MAFNLKNDQSLERIKRKINQKTSSIDVEVIPVSTRVKKGHHKTTTMPPMTSTFSHSISLKTPPVR